MVSFFNSIINFISTAADYFVGLLSSIVEYFGLITSSSIIFAELVGHLPSILAVCGQGVISIAIFKAIFGRQGAS